MGKFMTIYPTTDEDARGLAEKLVEITSGFHGPVVVTDLRLGDIVYTRYGGFNPIITRDRFGQSFTSITYPDSSLRVDAYSIPFASPDGIDNPFTGPGAPFGFQSAIDRSAGTPESSKSGKPFGPGYLVLEVVKQHPKGSIFRGIDLRSQEDASVKILKQGRQHCLSDIYGRDIRNRLQHQETLHKALHGTISTPAADPYFEVNGDGYLPLQNIDGISIESFAHTTLKNRLWGSLTGEEQCKSLSVLKNLSVAVMKMHRVGYVHRDLTASNILIDQTGQVFLLDLELAHAIDDDTPPFTLGTPGFMSPQQWDRKPPAFTDDIYALGCCAILLLTGLDPRRVVFARESSRTDQLLGLVDGVPRSFLEMVSRSTSSDAAERPTLEALIESIESCASAVESRTPERAAKIGIRTSRASIVAVVPSVLTAGIRGLLDETPYDRETGLWLSLPMPNSLREHAVNRQSGLFDVYRHGNRGVAGVVFLLARLARYGFRSEGDAERVQQVTQWLLDNGSGSSSRLPGLHFGEAGVAVAMAEAIAGGLIERDARIDSFMSDVLCGVLDWPDITHGAAGQGIAAIYCGERLHAPEFMELSHRCADYLMMSQSEAGAWKLPSGVEGISGEILTGFAHGVAGIVYFLAEYARRFGSVRAEESWRRGANWLAEQAISSEAKDSLEWQYSTVNKERWAWWCHGSPGIALTFLRLFEQTREEAFRDIASKALHVHPAEICYPNLSQCHGLSGLGEIYLEASRVLDGAQWVDRALHIAWLLRLLARESDGSALTWLVEDPTSETADLMVGASGVLHFFLRLVLQGKGVGFPLLLDPTAD
jgi:serine/threonine protein kinase